MLLAKMASLLSKNPSISVDEFYSCLMVETHHLNLDINGETSNKTLLYLACQCENVPLVRVLLAMGANPNYRSNAFQSILGVSIDSGNLDLIKMLVESGINLHHPYDQNTIENAKNTNKEIYQYLLEKRKHTQKLSEDKEKALIDFFESHKLSLNFMNFYWNSGIQWKLEKSENFQKIEEDLRQLHHGMKIAVTKENYFVVLCLLETRLIQFNRVYQTGSSSSLLKKIAEQGNIEIAALLIHYGDLVFNPDPISKLCVEDIANANGNHPIAKLINQTQEHRFKILEAAAVEKNEEANKHNYYYGHGLFDEPHLPRAGRVVIEDRENKKFHCCLIL